ncbi:DNA polymerase III subunit gamma and tau, partial [Pseudonocardia sp. N23]|uniref:DNA polymerase III subunit gamma and tau n=1 Tax=Pseudonocardia sp. N23 TaxID=1987376 RepID=UPI0011455BA5
MALALYRKYRPAKFAEVVGQEHVTEPLGVALTAGRINHAYLFSGPRGCGKTSSARILARSLNCELGPTPDPCGVCPSCIALAPEGPGSIDVVELDAASHGGVDDARELRDRAFYAPAESRYRVFIVDEAHMVTTQGFNALLKIVEEPPDHLVFVFATTEPEKVLPTIRSRTHHYPFRLIPPGTLRALLERICADEGVVVAPAVYPLVIRAGGGSARDTLSVLDQLLAGAGEEGVTYERAVALLGVTDVALVDDVVDGLAAADSAAVYEAVDRLVEAGHDPRRFAADLLQRLRDLTLLQAVPESAGQGLVEASADELDRMAEQAGKLGPATLARYGDIVHTGLTEMRGATAPRLLLELLCARMLLPAATTSDAALLERLERLERRASIEAPLEPGASSEAAEAAAKRFERPSRRRGDAPSEAGPSASVEVPEQPREPAASDRTAPDRADRVPDAAEPGRQAESAAARPPEPAAPEHPEPA